MNIKVLLNAILVIALIDVAISQRRGGRRRKKGDNCHLREVEKCFSKARDIGKGPDPTALITTEEGIKKICDSIRINWVGCLRDHFKKCSSPLHRELLDIYLGQVTIRVKKFCDAENDAKRNLLQHSTCMHQKVFRTDAYKLGCNNDFLRNVGQTDEEEITRQYSSHDILCCAFNTWSGCTSGLIRNQCSAAASNAFTDVITKHLGNIVSLLCPKDVYSTGSNICKQVKPPPAQPGEKLGDDAVSKYILSLISFFFVTDKN